jgi:hypothetical protein
MDGMTTCRNRTEFRRELGDLQIRGPTGFERGGESEQEWKEYAVDGIRGVDSCQGMGHDTPTSTSGHNWKYRCRKPNGERH